MPSTTCADWSAICEPCEPPPKEIRQRLSSSTLGVMSWTCTSTSAAKTMAEVMSDMMRGAKTPRTWSPKMQWTFHVERERVWLVLTQRTDGLARFEEEPELPF